MHIAQDRMEIANGSLTAYLDTSVKLLRTIAGVLDIRAVLPRLSEIANRVLPHDALTLGFLAERGRLAIGGATGDLSDGHAFADGVRFDEDVVIHDLRTEGRPVGGANHTFALLRRGYRSLLTTTTRASDQVLAAAFWWKHPFAFDRRQLPLARRVVEHIAVAVSHERLARAAAAAHALATRDDGRRRLPA